MADFFPEETKERKWDSFQKTPTVQQMEMVIRLPVKTPGIPGRRTGARTLHKGQSASSEISSRDALLLGSGGGVKLFKVQMPVGKYLYMN